MTRVCLAIGVGDAPPLDYLSGAVNGARGIAVWADEQGYETCLLTDERKPIEFQDIANALTALLVGEVDRLLLYFAGHGLSTGVADDLWLLSNWNRVRQGVSVLSMRHRLMCYGVSQLVIISDACRTLIDADNRDVTGNPVLNRGPFDEKFPYMQMDCWLAASPARAAWMIPGRTSADSRCIFTGLMIEALSGAHLHAFELHNPAYGITNFSLADFLEKGVPLLAARYSVTLMPEIQTGLRPPRNVYVPGASSPLPTVTPPPWPDPKPGGIVAMVSPGAPGRVQPPPGMSWTTQQRRERWTISPAMTLDGFFEGAKSFNPPLTLADVVAKDEQAMAAAAKTEDTLVKDVMASFKAETRPDHFETGAGFTLTGAVARRGLLGHLAKAQQLGDTGWWRIDPCDTQGDAAFRNPWWRGGIRIRQPLPLLVELSDGRWVGAAVLPNFVLSFTLDDNGAQAVLYRSMEVPYAPATEAVMASLRAGSLRREKAPELFAKLRQAKHADPMLGVLAAYLHEAMGDFANVHRTAYYFAEMGQPIPFDIALLGRLVARRDDDGLVHVAVPPVTADEGSRRMPSYIKSATPSIEGVLAGAFPLVRQGWELLDPKGRDNLYPPGMAEITCHLLPAPFTTFGATGGAQLSHLIFSQE